MTIRPTFADDGLRGLARVALPMVFSSATETLMLFVDRLFLSRLSMLHMSAAMAGGLSSFVLGLPLVGTVDYVNTLVAQHHGAGQDEGASRSLIQGLWFGLLSWPLVLVLLPFARNCFTFFQHSALQVELEVRYFSILVTGLPLSVLRAAFAAYFIGLGRTSVVMLCNLFGTLVNIPLNWALIFGLGPLPALGIEGAALGTLGGSLTALIGLFAFWWGHPLSRAQWRKLGWGLVAPRPRLLGVLVRYGFPVGAEAFLNTLAFTVFAQLMQSYGEAESAAVTIAFNFDMVSFIPMFGLGVAVASLSGQRLGAGDLRGAQRRVQEALGFSLAYGGMMALLFFLGAPWLVAIFLNPRDPFVDRTRELAIVFLQMAGLYTLGDAVQTVFRGGLLAAGDTRWILVVSAGLHWGLVALTFLGVRVWHLDPQVVWALFIIMVLLLGGVTYLRYRTGRWREIRLLEEANAIETPRW